MDVLIGYDYAGFHPEKERSSGHLLLLRNRFGRCIGGTHPSIRGSIKKPALGEVKPVHYVKGVKLEDFYNIENLGINCTPRCGGCKCGKCAPGSNNYTLKEEREFKSSSKKAFNTTSRTVVGSPNIPGSRIPTYYQITKGPLLAEFYLQSEDWEGIHNTRRSVRHRSKT